MAGGVAARAVFSMIVVRARIFVSVFRNFSRTGHCSKNMACARAQRNSPRYRSAAESWRIMSPTRRSVVRMVRMVRMVRVYFGIVGAGQCTLAILGQPVLFGTQWSRPT